MHNLAQYLTPASNTGLSMEAIDYQADSPFGKALEAEFTKLSENRHIKIKDAKDSKIPEIIKKFTNITTTLVFFDDYNAFAMFPLLDKNHPFFTWEREYVENKDSNKLLAKRAFVELSVDLVHGRLGGSAAEIVHEVGIGLPFIGYNALITPAEATGILLHEIGHLFTYYEFMIRSLSTNYLLTDFTDRLLDTHNPEVKMAIIKEAKQNNFNVTDSKLLMEATSKDAAKIIILKNAVEQSKSDLGADIYDTRGWEMLADQFATRHGYGLHVATGLDKLYKEFGIPRDQSFPLMAAFGVLLIIGSWGLMLLILLVDNQQSDYDDFEKRNQVIRKNMIANLKQEKNKDKRRNIVAEITAMDELLKEYNDEPNLFQFIQAHFGPQGRGKFRTLTTQKLLENFANSELNVLSSRFND